MQVILALSYGSRDEIVRAARKIVQEALAGRIDAEKIDEELFATHLDTHGIPDPDLFIRTSGEMRLSNFLLWQMSYTELYVANAAWPDFSCQDLDQAILEYGKRQRRFGMISEQLE